MSVSTMAGAACAGRSGCTGALTAIIASPVAFEESNDLREITFRARAGLGCVPALRPASFGHGLPVGCLYQVSWRGFLAALLALRFILIVGHSPFKDLLQRIEKPKCRLLVCLRLKLAWLQWIASKNLKYLCCLLYLHFQTFPHQRRNALVECLPLVFKQRHQLLNADTH